MKAFLIDPLAKTIALVDYAGEDFHEIYQFIGGNVFGAAYFSHARDHVYYRDDIPSVGPGFRIAGYGAPLAGKGLVLGQSGSKDASPTVDLDWLRQNVSFCHL